MKKAKKEEKKMESFDDVSAMEAKWSAIRWECSELNHTECDDMHIIALTPGKLTIVKRQTAIYCILSFVLDGDSVDDATHTRAIP